METGVNMTYRGHIKNGVGALDDAARLPEGTAVRIEVEYADADFWKNKSIEDLIREQGVKPIQNFQELAIDWPEEDSIEEFLAFIREVRR